MKFFWRAKTAEQKPEPDEKSPVSAVAQASSSDGASPAADAAPSGTSNSGDDPATNVVTLQPAKLTERIAAAATKTASALTTTGDDDEKGVIAFAPGKDLPVQQEAVKALSIAIASNRDGANILLIGPAGTGRRSAAARLVELRRPSLERPGDWLYATAPGDARRLDAYAMPHGQGALFVREVKAAIARAEANHARLAAGDDYRLGLEIIDEEFRHRTNRSLDQLKRRAEAQNIALVKTPEGFVLAPMHEGKVVRNDVFRALPESLQRDVESKIASLEGELKAFIEGLPAQDAAQGERIAAFNRDTAARAVKSQFEPVRAAFNGAGEIIDRIEASLVAAIAQGSRVHDGAAARNRNDIVVLGAQIAADFSEIAPFVVAHDVSPEALLGEFGTDADARLRLKPGALMRANGGFLLIEAWRLAARPDAWLALSAALETGEVVPVAASSLILDVEPLPVKVRLVVVGDDISIQKLSDLDPGLLRFFPHVVRFLGAAPRSAVSKAAYAEIAAALAVRKHLKPLAAAAAGAIYDEACISNSVSLNLTDLSALLYEADRLADAVQSASIRAEDIKSAASRIREARTP